MNKHDNSYKRKRKDIEVEYLYGKAHNMNFFKPTIKDNEDISSINNNISLIKLKNELDIFIPKYSINLSNTCFSFIREILLLIEEISSLPLNVGLKKSYCTI